MKITTWGAVIWIISAFSMVFFLAVYMLDSNRKEIGPINTALRQGNQLYDNSAYLDALSTYQMGLSTHTDSPAHKKLSFNSAQTTYALEQYEEAVDYYRPSTESEEKFLRMGNALFKCGEAAADENEKNQYLLEALQIYHDGIIKYPQYIPLKYNFEFVSQLIDAQMENQEEDNQQEPNNEENIDNQEEQESQENQDADEQNSEETEANEENAAQEAQDSQQEENDENDLIQESQENEQETVASDSDENEQDPDWEAIERILQMLESREESSLKNNQEVMKGATDKYGW